MFQVRVQVNSQKDRIREDIIIALKRDFFPLVCDMFHFYYPFAPTLSDIFHFIQL